MIYRITTFYFSIISAGLLLSILGLWLAVIVPGIDRWNRRFFMCYFIVFTACCAAGLADVIMYYYSDPGAAYYYFMLLECLILSLPMPMLTVYLLHCCRESMRRSTLLHVVLGLWAVYLALLISAMFNGSFSSVMPDGQYVRGSLYPILLMPLVAILLFNLIGTVKRRERLTRRVYHSLLIAILPMMASLTVILFVDAFPLLDISYVLSALAMFSLILSDQIEQDLMHQRENLRQQQEITRQQQELASQRANIMVLQMRPHFIYNTLMSIYSLCNQDPQKARQVTKDFTDYLRRNFNAVASDDTIPFSAELEHTRAYLAVEKAQHEEMLLVEYDTQFTRFRLPPLTLQPIVENAVKHGMDPYAGPLHLTIRSCRADSSSVIVVEDNGHGFDTSNNLESHTALANIRQRLELMCGGNMEITSREAGGTIVRLTIPDCNMT